MPVEPKLGTLVDVAIKGVRVVGHPSSPLVRIADEHGNTFDMPPQAAIKRAGLSEPADAATLQERISSTLAAINRMADEQTLDPWQVHWLRKALDPNPRHWPPQPGDVWDDDLPFGPHLWFAQVVHGDSHSEIVMVREERAGDSRDQLSPAALLAKAADLRLAYRNETGDND